MPLSLSSIAIEEKNKLATDGAFLAAMSVVIPGETDPIRLVRNNENLTWKGVTWQAFPFEVDEVSAGLDGEVPQFTVRISNVSRAMETLIQEYDLMIKTAGYSPITVTLYVVNTKAVAANPNCDPETEQECEMISPRTDALWAYFTLSAVNLFTRRVPLNSMLKNHCRFTFKDARCGYTGATVSCGKTLAVCRSLDNSARFGGFPGIGYGGLKIAAG